MSNTMKWAYRSKSKAITLKCSLQSHSQRTHPYELLWSYPKQFSVKRILTSHHGRLFTNSLALFPAIVLHSPRPIRCNPLQALNRQGLLIEQLSWLCFILNDPSWMQFSELDSANWIQQIEFSEFRSAEFYLCLGDSSSWKSIVWVIQIGFHVELRFEKVECD